MNTQSNLFSTMRQKHQVAFTLIELLTVIAIIGVLAAIIIPTVGKVRQSAKATQCVSNLRQIGIASQMWTSDNRGRIVPTFYGDAFGLKLQLWTGHLAPYMGWVKPSPSAVAFGSAEEVPFFICPATAIRHFGYGHNYGYLSKADWVSGDNYNAKWVTMEQVEQPSRTVLITDSTKASDPSFTVENWKAYVRAPNSASQDWVVAFRHGGSANVVWVDAHVSREKENGPLMKDPVSGAASDALWKAIK